MAAILYLTDKLSLGSALFVNRMHEQGHDVHLLVPNSDPLLSTLEEKGLSVLISKGESRVSAIREAVDATGAQLVHVLDAEFMTFCAVKALRGRRGVSLVVNSNVTNGLGRWNRLVRQGLRHSRVDHVISHSHATRRYLRKLGVHYDHMTTIYPPCAIEAYAHTRKADLSEFGVQRKDLVIACACDVRPNTGVLNLLDEVKYLGTHPVIHILVIGHVYDERAYDLAHRNHTAHQIHFLGQRDDLLELLAASDVFVLPARRLDRIPEALVHAMGLGLPCVVSQAGGMRELVEHRMNGHLVSSQDPRELAKALNRYLRDPQLSRITGDNAQKTIRTLLHPDSVVNATTRVYDTLKLSS
jgi:glycosyltransferase involved in cell wall biosynthesis